MIKPINKHVLVERVKKENKAGLLLSTEENERYHRVLQMSDDINDSPIQIGSFIYVFPGYGHYIDEEHFIMPHDKIIGYIEQQ